MTHLLIRRMAFFCLLFLGFSGTSQAVPVLYSYTGNDLSSFSNITVPCEPLSLGCEITNISAEILMPDALDANLLFGAIAPTSWSITDGLSTVTNATPGFNFSFVLSAGTDANGDIDEWWFALITNGIGPEAPEDLIQIRTRNSQGTIDDQTDYCQTATNDNCTFTGIANVVSNPGSWTMTVVPVPAAAWLFMSGLGLLIGVGRRSVSV
jgi:hypothetical protein